MFRLLCTRCGQMFRAEKFDAETDKCLSCGGRLEDAEKPSKSGWRGTRWDPVIGSHGGGKRQ